MTRAHDDGIVVSVAVFARLNGEAIDASGVGSEKADYDDLLALPDDGLRHELIDGEHFVTPSPRSAHQLILGNLYLLMALSRASMHSAFCDARALRRDLLAA